MGDNSRCSVEHWEPKKWEGWPTFLRVGKETSYAHRQWNHSPAQDFLSHVCLRIQSPRHWSHQESFHWLWWIPDQASLGQAQLQLGMGWDCAGEGWGGRKRGPSWRPPLALVACTRWLGAHGAPHRRQHIPFSHPLFIAFTYAAHLLIEAGDFFCLVAGIRCSNMGLDLVTSPHKSGEQFLEVLAPWREHYPIQ